MFSLGKKFINKFVAGQRTSDTSRVYLDHASATPLYPEVVKAMSPYFREIFGNASAIHQEGQLAKKALDEARAKVAQILQIQPTSVTFTSGGTESNNLAIRGVVANKRKIGIPFAQMEIITTRIEHPATIKTMDYLAREGVKIHYVAVDSNGRVILTELKKLINVQTILVVVSYVNSEIGTIEDLGAIKRLLIKGAPSLQHILLYVDASQAPLWLPCELARFKIDLMSFDASKFGGPKGVGILAHGKGIDLEPIIFGGGQENGLRPGTEPLAQIVGATIALGIAQGSWLERSLSVRKMRDYFILQLTRKIPGMIINGDIGMNRVANNVNLSILGLDSEFAVVVFDTHGVAISTKSACSSAGGGKSAVVMEISGEVGRATSTLRFTLGETNTKKEIDKTVAILIKHLDNVGIR